MDPPAQELYAMIKTKRQITLRVVMLALTHSLVTANEPQPPPGPLPIPDRLVVLSFDDGNKSDITYVAPALQRLGFGATFFVSEGLGFGGPQRLSWDDVRQLDQMGLKSPTIPSRIPICC